ncbi:MAG TPA: transglycosylase family protein [Acidimicrobiales bacterium]|nr:transglycosylase family protein [Acidimicrobiales bacterium]
MATRRDPLAAELSIFAAPSSGAPDVLSGLAPGQLRHAVLQRAFIEMRLAAMLRSSGGASLGPVRGRASVAPRGWRAPRSWTDAAMHLSLTRLQQAAPRGQGIVKAQVSRYGSTGPSDGVAASTWLALRECESGDDYAADTGNGYYGAYQFSASTWWSVGYSGLPNEAPPAVQDAAAQALLASQGWDAWPACSAELGL